MRAHDSHGTLARLARLARLAALIGMGCSLVVVTGCGSSSTVVPAGHVTYYPTATRIPAATATTTALPDPMQSPTAVVVGATPNADPSQCTPASTVAPLPVTLTTLYAGDANGTITALNASDGSKRWSYATGVSAMPSVTPSGSLVYVANGAPASGSPTTILALGAADGSVKWQAQIPGSSSFGGGLSLQVAGGIVYASGADGILRALDGATGTVRWQFPTGGGVATLTVDGGTVYAQTYLTGGLVALRASDGTLLWRYATAAFVSMAPVVANGLIYVGQSPTTLVALNAATGAVHWQADIAVEHSPYRLSGAVAAGTGLYVNGFNRLFAFNASTGASCWAAPACGQGAISTPLLDGDALYETCFFGSPGPGSPAGCGVLAVDAHTGATRWTDPVHGFVHVTPASLVNGLLYVNGTQAQALRLDTGAATWRYPAQESQLNGVGLLVIGGTAYVGLADGTTHALGALDGTERWSAAVGTPLAAGA